MMHSIKIFDRYFEINNLSFDKQFEISLLAGIFGSSISHSPIVKAATSTIHTFNEAGVWVYEEKGIVTQISVLYGDPYIDFHPQKIFSGEIYIKNRVIKTAEDFLSIECKQQWLDEWEAEGSVTIFLENICCGLSGDPDTKVIEDLCFWFEN